MREYHAPLESGHFYHIYNRAVGQENLFREEKNHSFFLKKWNNYLNDYLDVWAYCLMPNHFHFVVQVKKTGCFPEGVRINKFLEDQFKRLFSSYALSFNKVYERSGSLFQKRFKRVKIDSRNYLITLIHYIHHNPIHHGFTQNYSDWDYSSYTAIASGHPTKVKRQKVLELFNDSKDEFLSSHEEMKNYHEIDHLIIE
jgi:REP element-mobilizing transposase RayT